ncbi:MAG TPA: DUF4349 domain-containing protein [Gaiellaceae bacterium]|jgi:hypothetical protein|nr:DUF4349 domain-containing protein [Gaiellaceae bacterium]
MSPSETLQRELRAARPPAPETLRRRVRELAAEEPAREPFLRRLSLRRLVLVAAPAAAALALLVAALGALPRPGTGDGETAAGGGEAATKSLDAQAREAAPEAAEDRAASPPTDAGALAPTQGRLQRYDAQLQLRVDGVDGLSSATQQAMRIARSLGGTVASVAYDAPSVGIGSASLTLRVPVERVQQAVVQLSGLGTILGQRYGIEDLQPAADDLAKQIETTQARIAELQSTLNNASLTPREAAVLRARLAEARRQLTDLRAALSGTRSEARLATIQLGLTTEEISAAPPAQKGALDRVLDILRWEALALLYVLVVAGPFLLVAFGVWLALRLRRRRQEQRLLAQT